MPRQVQSRAADVAGEHAFGVDEVAGPQRDHEQVVLGVGAGQSPQALVPAGTWQRATASATVETLVSCVVSPGFDFADFRAL